MIVTIVTFNCTLKAQQSDNHVKIAGAMKNVMLKGELYGIIDLDTISNKQHLYGFGPVEFMTGELLIIDGKSYKSSVLKDSSMNVEETYNVKAPFFGYANINNWTEHNLPDSIRTIRQLELFLDIITKSSARPFMFKLTGTVNTAQIHIVNLPAGSIVYSPDDVHKTQVNFTLINEQAEIIGFFSTEHKTIFTHHNTYLHMHLITPDRKKMGHLDDMLLKKGTVTLYLPAEL